MSRRYKPLRTCSFPGDPRYATMTLTATEEEFACLGKKGISDSLCSGQHFAVDSIAKGRI